MARGGDGGDPVTVTMGSMVEDLVTESFETNGVSKNMSLTGSLTHRQSVRLFKEDEDEFATTWCQRWVGKPLRDLDLEQIPLITTTSLGLFTRYEFSERVGNGFVPSKMEDFYRYNRLAEHMNDRFWAFHWFIGVQVIFLAFNLFMIAANDMLEDKSTTATVGAGRPINVADQLRLSFSSW